MRFFNFLHVFLIFTILLIFLFYLFEFVLSYPYHALDFFIGNFRLLVSLFYIYLFLFSPEQFSCVCMLFLISYFSFSTSKSSRFSFKEFGHVVNNIMERGEAWEMTSAETNTLDTYWFKGSCQCLTTIPRKNRKKIYAVSIGKH